MCFCLQATGVLSGGLHAHPQETSPNIKKVVLYQDDMVEEDVLYQDVMKKRMCCTSMI